jgi:acid phosphatase (class A)
LGGEIAMKQWRLLCALAMASLMGAGPAPAEAPSPTGGYLAAGEAPDAVRILPPPPDAKSGRAADDMAIFQATRSLEGQPRWALATRDADLHPAQALGAFACALGVSLDERNAPTLMTVVARSGLDAAAIVDPPKDHYARPRPYLAAQGEPPICVARSYWLAKSPAYPSGHAAASWAWGLILAELAPDRASEVLMRARSIGESRIVCGVHYLSDVEAGRDAGAALVARLHADPAFRADLDKARAEIAAARETPHVGAGECLVQDQAAAHPPY